MTFTGDLRGTGGFHEIVMVILPGSVGFQVTVSSRIEPSAMGLEPTTYTSEAVV